MKKAVLGLALAATIGLGSAGASAAVGYGEYQDLKQVEAQLKSWAEKHSQLVELDIIGHSAGGRSI